MKVMCSANEGNWAIPVQRTGSNSQGFMDSTNKVDVSEERKSIEHVSKKTVYPAAERIHHPSDENLCTSFFFGIFYTVFCLALFLPVFCLVIIILPISIVVRKLCFWASCGFCGSKSLPSAGDNLWLQRCHQSRLQLHEVNFPVLNVLFITEGNFSLGKLREIIGERWVFVGHDSRKVLHPRFTYKLHRTCAGYVFEKDEFFNIHNHVTEFIENSPRTKEMIERHIAEVSCTSFNSDRPLWEIKVIPKFGQEEYTAVFCRIHHALMDGICLTRMTLESLIDSPLCILQKKFYFRVSSVFMIILSGILGPIRILELLFWRRNKNILCSSKLSGTRTMVWSDAVSLKIVRKIRNATRTTVNEVLISCLSGALRKYLQHHGDHYPSDMRACIPSDLRERASPLIAENNISLVFLRMPVGTEGAIPRLWEVRRRIRTVKHSADSHIMSFFIKLCMAIFPECISRRLIDFFINKASCVFTSLSGPDIPVTLDDKRIKILTFWAPLKGKIGLGFSVYSYMNEIRLGIIADEALMHDPKFVAKEFEREVLQLSEHLANRIHVYQGLARRHSMSLRANGEGTSYEEEEDLNDESDDEPELQFEESSFTSSTVVEVQNLPV